MTIGNNVFHIKIYVSDFSLQLSFIKWFCVFKRVAIEIKAIRSFLLGLHFKYANWKYGFSFTNLSFRAESESVS